MEPRYTACILGRRFALTHTAYKYLDIGINVGPTSSVELILGDNKGNQIALSHAMWMAIIERRVDIERFLQSPAGSTLSIRDLVLELGKIHKAIVVKLRLYDSCMYMQPTTILFLLELEQCVEHVYFNLCQHTRSVSDKFKEFVDIARRNCATDKREAIKILREVSDKNSMVDCELLAYAVENIMYYVENEHFFKLFE